jgi:hypothetical protein
MVRCVKNMILSGIANPDDSRPATSVEDQPKSERWSVPPPALDPEAAPEAPRPTIPPPASLPPPPDSSST